MDAADGGGTDEGTTNMVINATAGALIAAAILGHAALGRISAPPAVVNVVAWAIVIIAAGAELVALFGHS